MSDTDWVIVEKDSEPTFRWWQWRKRSRHIATYRPTMMEARLRVLAEYNTRPWGTESWPDYDLDDSGDDGQLD